MDRPLLGRIHAVGARGRSRIAGARRRRASAASSRDWLLDARAHPARRRGRLARRRRRRRSTACARGFDARRRRRASCACTATAIPATCCGRERRARTSSTSTTPARARRCRTCGCCCRATARRCRAQLAHVLEGYERFMDFDPRELAPDRAAAHPAHDPPQRLDRAALERPGLPDRLSVVRRARRYWEEQATASCASRSRRCDGRA